MLPKILRNPQGQPEKRCCTWRGGLLRAQGQRCSALLPCPLARSSCGDLLPPPPPPPPDGCAGHGQANGRGEGECQRGRFVWFFPFFFTPSFPSCRGSTPTAPAHASLERSWLYRNRRYHPKFTHPGVFFWPVLAAELDQRWINYFFAASTKFWLKPTLLLCLHVSDNLSRRCLLPWWNLSLGTMEHGGKTLLEDRYLYKWRNIYYQYL